MSNSKSTEPTVSQSGIGNQLHSRNGDEYHGDYQSNIVSDNRKKFTLSFGNLIAILIATSGISGGISFYIAQQLETNTIQPTQPTTIQPTQPTTIQPTREVTREEYNQLRIGMTYDQVVSIIGTEGQRGPSLPSTETFVWDNRVRIFFREGKVVMIGSY